MCEGVKTIIYMKVNNMDNNIDNYGDDIDQFLKNQEHIIVIIQF